MYLGYSTFCAATFPQGNRFFRDSAVGKILSLVGHRAYFKMVVSDTMLDFWDYFNFRDNQQRFLKIGKFEKGKKDDSRRKEVLRKKKRLLSSLGLKDSHIFIFIYFCEITKRNPEVLSILKSVLKFLKTNQSFSVSTISMYDQARHALRGVSRSELQTCNSFPIKP